MNKPTLILLLLLTCCSRATSQTVLYEQDFEKFNSYNIGGGWNTSHYSGNQRWNTGLLYLVNGECFCGSLQYDDWYRKAAGITDCIPKAGDNHDVLMYTPPINFKGHSNVFLKFDSYFKARTNGILTEKAKLEISVDGGVNWNSVTNMPANKDLSGFETYYFDLSTYSGYQDVCIGFRYDDDGGGSSGWAVDNVVVFEAGTKDIQLLSVSPGDSMLSYATINTGISHTFKIFNPGLDTIHEFVLNYQQENHTIKTDTIRNVNISRFGTAYFTHAIADSVAGPGIHPVTAWLTLAGDTIHHNDTAKISIRGAYFMPQKLVAVEEGTATWDGFSVAGHVFMQRLTSNNPSNTSQVSVHDTDPMMNDAVGRYNQYLFNIDQNYTPYFLLDRRHKAIYPDSLLSEVKARQDYFGYADIHIDPKLNGNAFNVDVTIKPAIDLNGDYRAVLVITEDDVSGTSSAWQQFNSYAGGMRGPMGGYENKPNPVPPGEMVYQHVARGVYPSADGITNLPAAMLHNQLYNVHFYAVLDPIWNKGKLRANVFLIRQSDSAIINSNKILFYLDIKDKAAASADAFLYPNPASEQAVLQFNMGTAEKLSIQVTDITGRMLVNNPAEQYEAGKHEITIATDLLSPGIYLVNIISDTGKKALKMQVIH